MDYHLENLGPERFQYLCQALLVKEFPAVQCFPVAQPDGGRDAIAFLPKRAKNEFLVFQVKFVRNPLAETDPHKWLTGILKDEAPKLRTLIPKGASGYYLLTNVPGTSHLDTGSIDSIQEILKSTLPVPSQCWWRNDINRRLDGAWDLKWVYPDILSGPDLLRLLFESCRGDDSSRQMATIRLFLRDQFDRDRQVRFKQVELQNNLLDLFIDVPVSLRETRCRRQKRVEERHIVKTLIGEIASTGDPCLRREERSAGAATLLLHPLMQQHIPWVVLEGAPGQGKSTIVQYLCQIHRSRILNESIAPDRIPQSHCCNPIRLPFKVDIRDLATWLTRQDPFSAEDTLVPQEQWDKSLDSFLAAQVRHHAGGAAFSVDDVHAVIRASSILLVFDGLDEIAEIARRRDVVDVIARGVVRLSEIAISLQVVVTSRPAAFVNSPGMPEDTFCYLQLDSVTRPLINAYTDNWLRAKRLPGKESGEVKRILKQKLDQPHLRELARNPMQLAILLSLVHTRGSSLPDKRTALYESYVELFFSREAEKSAVVREHRDLLIDIHSYLAWILQSRAETGNNRGSISEERLQQAVRDYLRGEGHDPNLVADLFSGMVERVVALVSRVQGTYEFEVQPLREYFAARHLYSTAPYSPTGQERKGTLPDRFNAIARNFYWFNVTRFYAGHYSKGELASLVDCLEELANESPFSHTNHPQLLAATLLSDWVFTQQPKSMRKVTSLLSSGSGLRRLAAGASRRYFRSASFTLPKQFGSDEITERCFRDLNEHPANDYAWLLLELMKASTDREDIRRRWLQEVRSSVDNERTRWLEYGVYLEVMQDLTAAEIAEVMMDQPTNRNRLAMMVRSGQTAYCDSGQEQFQAVVEGIVDGDISVPIGRRKRSIVELLAQFLNPHLFTHAIESRQPIPLLETWRRFGPGLDPVQELTAARARGPVHGTEYFSFFEAVVESCRRTALEWGTELAPWEVIVERGRLTFGDRWCFAKLAIVAAGIRPQQGGSEGPTDLFTKEVGLCRRVRYARIKAGVKSWWSRQFDLVANDQDAMLLALCLLVWGGQTVLAKLCGELDSKLSAMDDIKWGRLMRSYRTTLACRGTKNSREVDVDCAHLPTRLSERTVVAVGWRANTVSRQSLFQNYLEGYDGNDSFVLEFCQEMALQLIRHDRDNWKRYLSVVAETYSKGVVVDHFPVHQFARYLINTSIIPGLTEEVAANPEKYPCELVELAQANMKQGIASRITPVAGLAQQGGWFEA